MSRRLLLFCSKKPPTVGSDTGEKKRLVFPLIPRRFRLQRSSHRSARRVLLSCSLLWLVFKCAIRARGFSSAFVKNKSKRRDTSGEHQKKNAYEKSNSS